MDFPPKFPLTEVIFFFLRQKKLNNYSCLVPHCAPPPLTSLFHYFFLQFTNLIKFIFVKTGFFSSFFPGLCLGIYQVLIWEVWASAVIWFEWYETIFTLA